LNQNSYRRLVSGENKGFVPAIARCVLTALSWPYSMVVRLRNRLYSSGVFKTHNAEAVVISVGNITVGGTGKTPLVIWLANFLAKKNLRCAILTRGYKIKESKLSDEPAVLAKSCPDARIIVNADRIAGANEAVGKFDCHALIMDDGFQHRRMNRDIDIVTIDATRPFGYGKVLPAGLLREPISSLRRADAAVLTRCDQVSEADLTQIEGTIRQVNPDILIARSVHAPVCARSLQAGQIELEQLVGKKVFAFCGIGNPDAFFETIRRLGLKPAGTRIFNDHHPYTPDCLKDMCEEARYLGADMLLTTQKDWNKAALPEPAEGMLTAYLAVELKLLAGKEELIKLIETALAGKIAKSERYKHE